MIELSEEIEIIEDNKTKFIKLDIGEDIDFFPKIKGFLLFVEKKRENSFLALVMEKKLKVFFDYFKIFQFKRSKRGKKRVSCPVLA